MYTFYICANTTSIDFERQKSERGLFMQTKTFDYIALALVIIGALNWGLIGFFNFNLVTALFGTMSPWISRVVYAVIGIAGIYSLTLFGRVSDNSYKA